MDFKFRPIGLPVAKSGRQVFCVEVEGIQKLLSVGNNMSKRIMELMTESPDNKLQNMIMTRSQSGYDLKWLRTN